MQFHIGVVLSVTTGKLLSRGGIGACYKILNYMTGDELHTHQLPRANKAARPAVLAQHPQLADETGEGVNAENIDEYLARMEAKFGVSLPLTPLSAAELREAIAAYTIATTPIDRLAAYLWMARVAQAARVARSGS